MQNDHIDPADLINENNPNLWDFEILDGVNFMNCNRIHPLKQKEIQKLVNSCAEDNGLDALIIFGSSVEFRCNSKSDIDMVVIRNDGYKKVPNIFFEINSDVDILFDIGERLKKILWERGVLVYRRG